MMMPLAAVIAAAVVLAPPSSAFSFSFAGTEQAVKSAEPKGEDADWMADGDRTHAKYAALKVPWNATTPAIEAAYERERLALEAALSANSESWATAGSPAALTLVYDALFAEMDGDGDGVLNEAEARGIAAALGLDDAANALDPAVDAWRARTLPRAAARKRAWYASSGHFRAVSAFATLADARATLVDPEARAAYDEAERERALDYAEGVRGSTTWPAALARLWDGAAGLVATAAMFLYVLACLLAALVVYPLGRLLTRVPGARARRAGAFLSGASLVALGRLKPRSEFLFLALMAPQTCLSIAVLILGGGFTILAYVFLSAVEVVADAWSAVASRAPPLPAAAPDVACACAFAAAAWLGVRILCAPRAAAGRVGRFCYGVVGSVATAVGRTARRAVKWLLASVLPFLAYTYGADFCERHFFPLLLGAAGLLVLVRPLRRAAVRALGRALADLHLAPPPENAAGVDRAQLRVGALPVIVYAAPEGLGDGALARRLEAAGFARRPDAAPATRAELVAAYEEAHGSCSVCFDHFSDGDATKRIDPCAHVFHERCLGEWMAACAAQTKVPTCPYCNVSLGDEDPAGPAARGADVFDDAGAAVEGLRGMMRAPPGPGRPARFDGLAPDLQG